MKLSEVLARQRVGGARPRGLVRTSLVLSAAMILVGCTEKLDSSAGCPIACVDPQTQVITDTLTAAVAIDTTVNASSGVGTEQILLLAKRGDSLDTRLIIRYDTLQHIYVKNGTVDTIQTVDSAFLKFSFDSTAKNVTAPVTISVYDVDGATNDTSTTELASLFTQPRLLGSRTLAPGKAVDTVSVPISAAIVQSKILSDTRLRVGVSVSSSQSVSLRQPSIDVTTSTGIGGVRLEVHTTRDTVRDTVENYPTSRPVGGNTLDALAQRDFTIIVSGSPAPPAATVAVGGIPTKRAYLRFALPPKLVDSSIVIRATLLLHQLATTSPDAADTMIVRPFVGAATSTLSDPERAGKVISTAVVFDSLITHPSTTGIQEIEIAPAFSVWALQDSSIFPRVIVLESGKEFLSPQQALFYSSDALVDSLRPKIRITYTPRTRIGTP